MLLKCLIISFLILEGSSSDISKLLHDNNFRPSLVLQQDNYELFFRACTVVKEMGDSRSIQVILLGFSATKVAQSFMRQVHTTLGPVILETLDVDKNLDVNSVMVVVRSEPVLIYLTEFQTALWNRGRYYVFVILEACPALMSILASLWTQTRVLNVIVSCNSNLNDIYLYNPFSEKGIGDVVKYTVANETQLMKHIRLRMNNMHLHPLRVTMFPTSRTAIRRPDGTYYDSSDGAILYSLARKMNFTPVTVIPEDGSRYGIRLKNGSFTGMLGDLLYNRTDISCNMMFIKDYETRDLVFTTPVDFDKLCIVVGKSDVYPKWMAMFLCFETKIWVAVLLMYIFTTIIWHLIRNTLDRNTPLDCVHLSLEMFQVLLNISLNRYLCTTSERAFMISTIVFTFILVHCFQSSLIKLYSTPTYQKDIETLEDLDRSGLHVHIISKNLEDTFAGDEQNSVFTSILRKLVTLQTPLVNRWHRVAFAKDIALIGKMKDLQQTVWSFTAHGKPLLHIVNECPRSYHIAYLIPKGSPYLNTINSVLGRMVSSGILDSWFSQYNNSLHVKYDGVWKEPEPFTLQHLAIAFFILSSGLALSVIIFLIELTISACKSRYKT